MSEWPYEGEWFGELASGYLQCADIGDRVQFLVKSIFESETMKLHSSFKYARLTLLNEKKGEYCVGINVNSLEREQHRKLPVYLPGKLSVK